MAAEQKKEKYEKPALDALGNPVGELREKDLDAVTGGTDLHTSCRDGLAANAICVHGPQGFDRN